MVRRYLLVAHKTISSSKSASGIQGHRFTGMRYPESSIVSFARMTLAVDGQTDTAWGSQSLAQLPGCMAVPRLRNRIITVQKWVLQFNAIRTLQKRSEEHTSELQSLMRS